jgi:hypothetical protein
VSLRLGTTSFATRIWTIWLCWFRVSLRTRIIPRSGREREGVTSSISLKTASTSPGRVGLGQLISPPTPMIHPLSGKPDSMSNFIVIAAVCQPLAANPLNSVAFAASPSR